MDGVPLFFFPTSRNEESPLGSVRNPLIDGPVHDVFELETLILLVLWIERAVDPCQGMERDTVLPNLDAEKVDPVIVVEPDHIVDEIAVETDGLCMYVYFTQLVSIIQTLLTGYKTIALLVYW